MGKYSYIGIEERKALVGRIYGSIHDENGTDWSDGFVAMAADPKYLVGHQKSTGVTFVVEYTHDHKPVQADAFERIVGFSTSVWGGDWETVNIKPLSEEEKSIVATALKASLCDVKAFDPVTPAGKVAPVRLCPMGGHVDVDALLEVMELFSEIGSCPRRTYPLSYTELDGCPFMALRTVNYDAFNRQEFRMRITACIPMAVHRVKDFNEMVHDVFGYKREDD